MARAGLGSVAQLAMALFLKRANLDMTAVHYRGNAPALADVIAGHVPAMFSSLADALPHADSGAVRLLAMSGPIRASQRPDVPTVAESGYPGFNVVTWNGLMAPSGTPKPIVDRIAAEMARAVKDAKFAERVTAYGVDPLGNSPAAFSALIAAEFRCGSRPLTLRGSRRRNMRGNRVREEVVLVMTITEVEHDAGGDRSIGGRRFVQRDGYGR